ncbi:tryptophan halogenase PrnA [Asticcacaulis biprosthecium C19]|uniref:Tryptophan halogenase PrnA n=1 Tax=Asticcacaulis biprosthecium C19 TaxID=715226 RepID=F4QGH6_9CAUL|nr:tryptophan halogenase family protein [Asticcacaulis biprosthecium]EGF93657.1 tryptophan halogenase PrnA [Asticcacaulis biprosthecium C19]
MPNPIENIVIVGGGTAGWMAAAMLAKLIVAKAPKPPTVTLIESDDISTVGVGEATIPAIKKYMSLLGINEADFLKFTQGTFKLGIEFVDWERLGESYIHGFGKIGQDLGWMRPHQYWLKMRNSGKVSPRFDDYAINPTACRHNRFNKRNGDDRKTPLNDIGYAYHFDAGLMAQYLRRIAEPLGVKRVEGTIVDVRLKAENGHVKSVALKDGQVVGGDFFIDCSGFRSLLIGGALGVGYESWSQWLPCDRALAVPCASVTPTTPYTRSTARTAGWQWRIPLQHRIGNGHVYSSRFTSDDEAARVLMDNLDGKALADPRPIRFETGKRKKLWEKNVLAVGLSGGFIEPLESTSIHLIQTTVLRLLNLFPDKDFDPATAAEYNAQADFEIERIRDFVIAHYKLTSRDDSEMWRYCRDMAVPDTLARKLDGFAASGRVFKENEELFAEDSWIQVLMGQGLMPRGYDPIVDNYPEETIIAYLNNISGVVAKCVAAMPTHDQFVAAYCAAEMP